MRLIILFSFSLSLFSLGLKAQDTLKFKNGDFEIIKFISVDHETIVYKRFENLDGPSYIVPIAEISSLNYKDGRKELFLKNNTQSANQANQNFDYAASKKSKNQINTKKPYKKSGPRIGCTILGEGTAAKAITDLGKTPIVSQLGWELEARIFRSAGGLDALIEANFFVAGIEQGMLLPSGNILIGLRGTEGVELALGPNFSQSGLGMEFMLGGTLKWKEMYFPVSVSFVPSVKKTETTYSYTGKEHTETIETGFRLSFFIGFYSKLK